MNNFNFSSEKNLNTKSPIFLYIHIPFCAKKCLFCSFAVAVAQNQRADQYIDALEKEMRKYKGMHIRTVYLGGGTPTMLTDEQLTRLCKAVKDNFVVYKETEWTIEANPEGIDHAHAASIIRNGFNRVSLGVQSFNDTYLKFLGRAHDATQAFTAYNILQDCGLTNINVDLMYGFPHQTRDELKSDLQEVIDLQSQHVSIYTLTIDPYSRFHIQQLKLDDDDKLGDHYEFVTHALEEAGLKQYEVSNFARPGFESRHNSAYWCGGDYIGLGMGAHSLLNNKRFWNTSALMDYLQSIDQKGNAITDSEELSVETRMRERLIFGLRTNAGVHLQMLEAEFSLRFPKSIREQLDHFIFGGFIEYEQGFYRTTMRGRLVLDDIATRLI